MQQQQLGFIFDWDGVIIDSHAQHEESWGLLFDELGRDMPDDFFKRTFGMRNQQIIPEWFDFVDAADLETIARLGGRKEELYRDILQRDGLEALPGVHDLLEELRERGIPAAVGSSTPRVNIDFVMDMIGLAGMFDATVTAEDVTAGKPDPQVFLKAAAGIHRDPVHCIVFEDAYVGIEAGKRAGMKVVAVATTHPRHTLTDADVALPNLADATVDGLLAALGLER
jgi:beta-phosphoglucomutase family hydrolase